MTLAETEAAGRQVSLNGIKNARPKGHTMPNDWRTAAELAGAITSYRKAIHTLIRENHSHGATDAGELIAHIYSFAGTDDTTANTKGQQMLRAGVQIQEHLEAIDRLLGVAKSLLKEAGDFLNDEDARRRHAASAYRV